MPCRFFYALIACLLLCQCDCGNESGNARQDDAEIHRYALIVEPLINIGKLDTLSGKRAATRRLRKLCYWLEKARQNGLEPGEVIAHAHNLTEPQLEARAIAQAESLLRNRDILEKLGCLDADGMEKL